MFFGGWRKLLLFLGRILNVLIFYGCVVLGEGAFESVLFLLSGFLSLEVDFYSRKLLQSNYNKARLMS